MLVSITVLILSMVIIWKASDGFEAASEYLGRNLNDGVRGATINAIGSSMPELFTTFIGLVALKNTDGFAFGVGTTAGSAIFNAMIIPAVVIIAVIIKKLSNGVQVSRKVILRDGISLMVAEFILILLLSGSVLKWWHGLILMITYGAYLLIVFKTMGDNTEKGEEEEEEEDNDSGNSNRNIFFSLLILDLQRVFLKNGNNNLRSWSLLVCSMFIIGIACAGLVDACENLANSLGIAPYFIAVILASAATSVPDTIISIRDAFDGDYDDAVANALGSNIFDICFALGFPLFIYTIFLGDITLSQSSVTHIAELRGALLFLTLATFLVFISSKYLNITHAIVLIFFYVLFTVFVIGRANNYEWTKTISNLFQTLFL